MSLSDKYNSRAAALYRDKVMITTLPSRKHPSYRIPPPNTMLPSWSDSNSCIVIFMSVSCLSLYFDNFCLFRSLHCLRGVPGASRRPQPDTTNQRQFPASPIPVPTSRLDPVMGMEEAVIMEDSFVRATAQLGWDTQRKCTSCLI